MVRGSWPLGSVPVASELHGLSEPANLLTREPKGQPYSATPDNPGAHGSGWNSGRAALGVGGCARANAYSAFDVPGEVRGQEEAGTPGAGRSDCCRWKPVV